MTLQELLDTNPSEVRDLVADLAPEVIFELLEDLAVLTDVLLESL